MTNSKSVLIVAAHPDDEVIGCGGTAAIHARNGDIVHVLIVAEGATSRSDRENTDLAATLSELKKAGRTAAEILGLQSPMFLSLPDNRLDNIALLEITQKIETVIE